MMMIPRRSEFDIFDEIFNEPFFNRQENKWMRTDIKEQNGNYVLEIDLPGYEKEDIQISLNEGYLSVTAKQEANNDSKDEVGNYIRKERFIGQCSRSYFVGKQTKEEDIKASFKNGTLKLVFPKEQEKQIEERKFIEIGD